MEHSEKISYRKSATIIHEVLRFHKLTENDSDKNFLATYLGKTKISSEHFGLRIDVITLLIYSSIS